MDGCTDTLVDTTCYGTLLQTGCSLHRCIQQGLWHFRSATSRSPQRACLRWQDQIVMTKMSRNQEWKSTRDNNGLPNLLKRTLHQATQSLGESVSSSDVLREECPAHPCWIYLLLPTCEPSNNRVQDKYQTRSHQIIKASSNVVTVHPHENILENCAARKTHAIF